MDQLDIGPGGLDDSDALRSGHIKPAAPLPPRESGKIDLRSLRAFGGVISAAPVPKEVEWKHDDPETGEKVTDKFTVHILRHSYGAMERMVLGEGDRSKGALLISNCVRFGDAGDEVMSYEDAYQLDPGLAAVFMKAINEVNAAKNSPPPMKSGTN